MAHALDGIQEVLQVALVEAPPRVALVQVGQRALVDEQPQLQPVRLLLDEELLLGEPLQVHQLAGIAVDEKIGDVELGLDAVHGFDAALERPKDAHWTSDFLGSTPCARNLCATRSDPVRSQRS